MLTARMNGCGCAWQGRPEQPQALATRPSILFAGLGNAVVCAFITDGKRDRVKVSGPMRCNTVGANLAACSAGQGFGRFLHDQAAAALQRGALLPMLQGDAPSSRPLSLVYPRNRHGSARLSTLVEHLSAHLPGRLGR